MQRHPFAVVCSCYAECFPLTISYHLYFLRVSKVWSILHNRSVERFESKEFYYTFAYTLVEFFCCFSANHMCFYYFNFFFWWSIKSPQQNINQLETGTCDKKLSVELYVQSGCFWKIRKIHRKRPVLESLS